MAATRTGLTSWILSNTAYDWLWGHPSVTPTLSLGATPIPTPVRHLGETPSLSTNPMENLKTDLWKYAEIFREQKRLISEIREKLMLLPKKLERTDTHLLLGAGAVPTSSALSTKPLEELKHDITEIVKIDGPLLDEILADTDEMKDIPAAVKLCDKVIKLFDQLDIGLVHVKGDLQDARDHRSILLRFIQLLLAWKNIPDLTPASISERNDDRLYIQIKPSMDDFFQWLDKTKVFIERAKKQVEGFLEEQRILLGATEKKSEVKEESSSDTVHREPPSVPEKHSAAVIVQRLADSGSSTATSHSEVKADKAVSGATSTPVLTELKATELKAAELKAAELKATELKAAELKAAAPAIVSPPSLSPTSSRAKLDITIDLSSVPSSAASPPALFTRSSPPPTPVSIATPAATSPRVGQVI